MKKQPLIYRVNVIGMALGMFGVLRIVLPGIFRSLGMYNNDITSIAAYVITLAVSSFLPTVFIEKMCESYPVLFKNQKPGKNRTAIVIFGLFAIICANFAGSLFMLPLKKMGIVFPQDTIGYGKNGFTLILYFLSITVVPAIFEELFLRGMVINRLMPYGRQFAVLFSAVMFMLMHTKINGYPAIFAAGIVLACVYVYTDNIFISMALHFANNSYSFLMMYIQQYIGGISSVGAMIFVIMSIIILGVWRTGQLQKENIHIFSVLKK